MEPVLGVISRLWSLAAEQPAPLPCLQLSGVEPAAPSSFRIGAAAQASVAAATLAAAELWRRRNRASETPSVAVDMRHAVIEFASERFYRIKGAAPGPLWDPIAGVYPCADGWVRVHSNFEHHRDALLSVLGAAADRDVVAWAIKGWSGAALETACVNAGGVATMLRSFDEWDNTAPGRALRAAPPVLLERVGDAPAQELTSSDRPLSGFRALDLTRIIAGPVAARCLAGHGADVMRISAPDLPYVSALTPDTCRGKLNAFADLKTAEGCEVFSRLVGESDVLINAFRPGALAARGFDLATVLNLRPGLVVGELCAYGFSGPWAQRRGFDSLVQCASGFNHAEALAAGEASPKPLPVQALDHASGYLLAFGLIRALTLRAEYGGSWRVRVSLAGVGAWLRSLGRLDNGFDGPAVDTAAAEPLLEPTPSALGEMVALRHSGGIEGAAPRFERPVVPMGSDAPEWPG